MLIYFCPYSDSFEQVFLRWEFLGKRIALALPSERVSGECYVWKQIPAAVTAAEPRRRYVQPVLGGGSPAEACQAASKHGACSPRRSDRCDLGSWDRCLRTLGVAAQVRRLIECVRVATRLVGNPSFHVATLATLLFIRLVFLHTRGDCVCPSESTVCSGLNTSGRVSPYSVRVVRARSKSCLWGTMVTTVRGVSAGVSSRSAIRVRIRLPTHRFPRSLVRPDSRDFVLFLRAIEECFTPRPPICHCVSLSEHSGRCTCE